LLQIYIVNKYLFGLFFLFKRYDQSIIITKDILKINNNSFAINQ